MQGGEAAWNTKKLTNNASYGLMPLPTKSGYTFDGWYTEASGGTKITSYRRVRLTGNQTLYAHWAAVSYTITLVGASSGVDSQWTGSSR